MKPVDINAVLGGFVDRGIWYYYDTATVAQAASTGTQISFFAIPQGPTKSKLLTNMTLGNQFPPPRCLIMDNLGFYFNSNVIKPDVDLIVNNCYCEFRIDDKIFFEGHLWRYASGYGIVGTSTQTGESAWNIGKADITANLRFGQYSKYIAPQQLFSLVLNFPTAQTLTATADGGVGIGLIAMIQGLTDRSVQ